MTSVHMESRIKFTAIVGLVKDHLQENAQMAEQVRRCHGKHVDCLALI